MNGLMMQQPLLISSLLTPCRAPPRRAGDRVAPRRRRHPSLHLPRAGGALAPHGQRAGARCGVALGDRVATLAWNGYRHLELYYARLRLGRGAAHAQPAPAPRPGRLDRRPRRRPGPVLRPDLPAAGRGDRRARVKTIKAFVAMTDRAHMPAASKMPEPAVLRGPDRRRSSDRFDWPDVRREPRPRRCATRRAPPAIRRARSTATARRCCTPTPSALPDALNCSARDVILPVVPMFHVNAWGLPYAACMVGAKLVFPGPGLDGKSLLRAVRERGRHAVGRRADRLAGPARATSRPTA